MYPVLLVHHLVTGLISQDAVHNRPAVCCADGLPNIVPQLRQRNAPLAGVAAVGGFCAAFGDMALQYAIAYMGYLVAPSVLNASMVVVGKLTENMQQNTSSSSHAFSISMSTSLKLVK